MDVANKVAYGVVVLIDMQGAFVHSLREGEGELLIMRQIRLLQHCAKLDIPVLVCELDTYGPTLPELACEFRKVKRVAKIIKQRNSAFDGTDIENILKLWNAHSLFLTGIYADYCVLNTAQDALRKGHEICVSPTYVSGTYTHSDDNSMSWYKKWGRNITFLDDPVRERLLVE